MTKTVTALVEIRPEADMILSRLDQAGFTPDQVSILTTEETRGQHFALTEGDKSDEGALTGAAVGGLTGALDLGLASAGTLLIPGLNLVVGGALIGALAGLGAGAAAGGLVGALVGAGIPEHEAKIYEDHVQNGGILLAVRVENDSEERVAKDILKDANAKSIRAAAA